MHQRVAEFAAFMDRAWRLRRGVAGNPAGKGKLPEQFAQAVSVAADVGIDLAVTALEIGIRHHAGSAVTRTADIDNVKVAVADRAVEVGINEVQPRRGAPMSEQPWLDVIGSQRFVQQRIAEQIDLSDREIIRCAPVAVNQV